MTPRRKETLYSHNSCVPLSVVSDLLCSLKMYILKYLYLSHLHTYLLTPWSRVLLEKLTGSQLVKNFPAFYGNWRFITACTGVPHLSLSWARSIQSMLLQPTSWRSILLLFFHPQLGLPRGFFPSDFATKTLYKLFLSPKNLGVCFIYIWQRHKILDTRQSHLFIWKDARTRLNCSDLTRPKRIFDHEPQWLSRH